MIKGFHKITPINGFDRNNSDNARQNNYAWSMEELGDYIYVGTGRNIVYFALKSGAVGNIKPPGEFTPSHLDMNGEIWRCKKHGKSSWELSYKSPKELNILGYRFMIKFTTKQGETALYAGAYSTLEEIILLKYTDSNGWKALNTEIKLGNSTRSMVVQQGKLYMSVIDSENDLGAEEALIYESCDPENQGWKLVTDSKGDENKNPSSAVIIMEVFNGQIYAGCSSSQGFEIWRTNNAIPKVNDWTLVVDKGAGDAANEIAMSMGIFKDYLYVGSAIYFGILSVDFNIGYIPPKGFDLIRIDKHDNWQLVIGGQPQKPTNPTTGKRNVSISGISSGFNFVSNAYCWQIQQYKNELYVGSWDWSDIILPLYNEFISEYGVNIFDKIENEELRNILKCPELMNKLVQLIKPLFGFDLYKTKDGVKWNVVTINGLNNGENYGVRKLFLSEDRKLYLGTANPFQGCEVWVKGKDEVNNENCHCESLKALAIIIAFICFVKHGGIF